ncbi:phosphatidate cytidylyltransferase [Bailinhaonella thermotolerans]|uniref:phosphatidate cytidylyltransferase n=1 Tax=Bailinhaonella thermotolerans TaxID=1070861 RepID=UPI001F5BE967|nr:phosphatidate cytidylyltransferase [Bailinhaonella thermotolerans]
MNDSAAGSPSGSGSEPGGSGSGDETASRTAAPGPEPGASRTGRNLPAAIGVGVLLGALVILSLYTVKQIFVAVVVLFLGLGVFELVKAVAARDIRVPLWPVLAGGTAMLVGAYAGGPVSLAGAFALTVLAVLTWRMFAGGIDGYVRDATASVFVLAYAPLLAGFVMLMLAEPDGAHRVVVFIAVTVSSDIGGYAAGVLFGKHRMSPVISPKKTWEGFAGSALACMLVGAWLLSWLLDAAIWQGALLGLVAVVCATLGDLIESVVKRDLGIKDMGTLLPGHGGVMDRLDSLLAVVVPAWLLMELFVS